MLLWKEFNSHSFIVTFNFSHSLGSPFVFYPAVDSCWIHVNVGCSTCIYSTPLVVSLNDKPWLAHWRQHSAGFAFQFHYTPTVISWSHRWQPGADLLHLALIHDNGTSSSDNSSAEVPSVAYMVFTSRESPHTSLMIILALWVESSLSLPLYEVSKPMMGRRSLTWQGIPSTRMFCGLITSLPGPRL